jgi:rod shape-determining protein MreD
MRKLFFLFAIIVLATLGLSWPEFLVFFHCKPDLLLVFTVGLVFCTDFKTAVCFGILAGLAKDAFLPSGFGINTLCFGLWSYFTHRISRQISTKESYVRLSIIFVVALLNNVVLGLAVIASGSIISPGIFLRNLIVTTFYTTLLSPLIFKLTDKLAL